jgi:peptidoglycan/LPS O-acetylase OafA/YrhL
MEVKPVQRRYDLDWLRVLAFSGVFLYHCSRFFNSADWHIKNLSTSPLVDIFTNIFDLWGMPLIFAISGASIFFAVRPNGAARFLRERATRLLVPMALGILVLAPPQVYFDRLTHGKFSGSFFEFLPHYFELSNFSWNGIHLWYLVYLFIFTVALTPLFIWLKTPGGHRAINALGNFSAHNGAIYLWAIPIALVAIAVDPFGMLKPAPSEALIRLVMFPLPLFYGFLIYAHNGIQAAIIRQRRSSLFIAIGFTLVALLISIGTTEWGWRFNPPIYILIMSSCSLLIWCYLLSIFGYGMRYLTTNKPSLSYANEAVLPIYILHQPVILSLGYYIVNLPLPIIAKYLIITPLAFCITLGLYEYGIRRVNLLRRAFGLKPRKNVTSRANVATQPFA